MAFAMETLHTLASRATTPGENRNKSNSLSTLFSTLIPIIIVATIVILVFSLLRMKMIRVYQPRSLETVVHNEDRTPPQSAGFFGWVPDFKSLADTHVLHHQSLDGFLFLRFLKMLSITCFVGCVLTWPILFPVNATGHGGQSQLDILSFSNVLNPSRYFAHAIVAWIFLGFVVYVITRERLFYIGLRQAYYLSSFHAQRLSSRTVLFLGIPEGSMKESRLRELLGPHVRKIWLVPDCNDLQDLVDDKDKLWKNFEKGEVKMITGLDKKFSKDKNTSESDALKLLDPKDRPTHRLKPIIGKKVDTINYGRAELPKMWQEIEQKQNAVLDGSTKWASAAFVEFSSQAAAQEMYQIFEQKEKFQWHPRLIGIQPVEIIWKNLGVGEKARKSRMALATAFIVLLTIFWTIPVAFVGVLTNINYLTSTVPFLSFINSIPSSILGIVTGLLPTILLAVLLALVPIICRLLAKFAGSPTLTDVELKTQSWYFIFQVIQVFLITTFTSGAASVAGQIVKNPASAVTLLATNLPKASNFYISYFILQGLMQAALLIANFVPLLMIMIVYKFLDKTPRSMYNRWMSLTGLGWGSIYPKFTNLGVIAIAYSCIAPLVLGFATIGFALLYLGFRYNFLFVYGVKINMKGQSFGRALNQLFTGVYLSVICLIGLFAIKIPDSAVSTGPMILMIIFLVLLIVYQILLDRALSPLEQSLPLDLVAQHEESIQVASRVEEGKEASDGTPAADEKLSAPWKPTTTPEQRKYGFFSRKVQPYIEKHYQTSQKLFTGSWAHHDEPRYSAEEIDNIYLHPALLSKKPFIWLPKDRAGLSKVLLDQNKEAGLEGTDKGAWINEKGKIEWNMYQPHKAPVFEENKNW